VSSFSMTVEEVFAIKGRGTIVTGRIASGTVRRGDGALLVRNGFRKAVQIEQIESFDKLLFEASAGSNVGLQLQGIEKAEVRPGDTLQSDEDVSEADELAAKAAPASATVQADKERSEANGKIPVQPKRTSIGVFKRLFGGRKTPCPSNQNQTPQGTERFQQLVTRLASNDESVFDSAMTESCKYGPAGSDFGIRAMEDAMRQRAGRRDLDFLEPTLGSLTVRSVDAYANAPERILQLAQERALLRDPRLSQDLISASLASRGTDVFCGLIVQVEKVGGTDQMCGLLLLYNHLSQATKLAHARGARSWTESASEEA